jgi:methyl-accepting chemotaxis protein
VFTRVLRRLSIAMAIGWVAALSLSIVLPTLGFPAYHPVARAEVVTGGLIAMVVIIAGPTMLFHPLRAGLQGVQVEISEALHARRLEGGRVRTSLSTMLRAQHIATIVALTLAGGAIAGLVRVQERRADALGAQLHLAMQAVLNDSEPPGVRVVAAEQLPALLGELPDAVRGDSLTAFDPANEQVLAAVARGDGSWALAVATPDEKLGRALAHVFGLCGILLGMGFVGGDAIGRAVVEPLEQLDALARELLERGELARIPRVTCPENDEVGALASTFNRILDAFMQLALAAKTVAGGDLRVEIDQVGDLPDAFRAMLAHLRAMVVRLRETSVELSVAASELSGATEAHARAAQQQSHDVGHVSDLMQALAQSTARITAAAEAVRANAEQSLATTNTSVAQASELERHVRGIRELLSLIDEIADRSDLLALNGSLEAVRAGELGRSFALVAAEMRRLAERVADAVEDIHGRIAGIDVSTQRTVQASEHTRVLTTGTVDAAREIDAAARAQASNTGEAVEGIGQASRGVRALVEASTRVRTTAEGLRAQAQRIEGLTSEFRV